MCLALPAKILALHEADMATVDVGGVRKEIYIGLVGEVGVGDYVIIHVGYALSRVDEDEAQKTLAIFAEIEERFPEDKSR